MSEFPSEEEILESLNRSGYLFEQEIADKLEAMDFTVKTNRAFLDHDINKSREIDISALKIFASNEDANLKAYYELICECKNTKNPFVFIGRSKSKTDVHYSPREYIFPYKDYMQKRTHENGSEYVTPIVPIDRFQLRQHHHYLGSDMKYVQFCKIVRDRNTWKANHEGIFDSIVFPIVKAFTSRKNELLGKVASLRQNLSSGYKDNLVWLFFPVVVLSSNIYLIDSERGRNHLVETDHVTLVREIKTNKLEGPFIIEFVTKNGLDIFINEIIKPFLDPIADIVNNRPDDLTQHTFI